MTNEIIYRCPKEHPIALSINDVEACKIEITREIFVASKSKEKATNTLCIDLIIQIEKFGKRIQQERNKSSNDERETAAISKPVTINDDSSDGEIFDEIKSKIEEAKKLKENEAKRQRTSKSNYKPRSRSRDPRIFFDRLISDYKYQYENASKRIETKYIEYQIVPDTHPKYDLEWKYYWIRKVKLNPGIDYKSSDFIEAWKKFFKFRLNELKLEDTLKERIRIRQELNLPVEPVDSQRLERILINQSDDKKMAANFDYEELVRKSSPKRKREADINLNEIEQEVHSKMTNRDRLTIIKQKINKPNFSPYKGLQDSQQTEIPKDIRAETPKIMKDDNNNDVVDQNTDVVDQTTDTIDQNTDVIEQNNQADDLVEQSSNEGDKILTMEDHELKVLFTYYYKLSDEIKSQLTAYMEELKNRNPEKHEELINVKLEILSSESSENKISISDDDDDDEDNDEELMRNVSKNAEALPKPSAQESINLAERDTEYVDMTVSD